MRKHAFYVSQGGQENRNLALREIKYRRQLGMARGTHAHADVICWNH